MNKLSKLILISLLPIIFFGCQNNNYKMESSDDKNNLNSKQKVFKNDLNIRNSNEIETDKDGFFNIDDVKKVFGGNIQIWDWKDFVGFTYFDIGSFSRKAAILKSPTTIFPNFRVKNGKYPSLTYNCENNLVDIEEGDAISQFKLSLKSPPVYTFRFGGPDGVTGVAYGGGNTWNDIRIEGQNVYFDGQPKFDLPRLGSLNFNKEFTKLIQEYNLIEMSVREEGKRDGIYIAWQLDKPFKKYAFNSACSLMNANKVIIPVRGN